MHFGLFFTFALTASVALLALGALGSVLAYRATYAGKGNALKYRLPLSPFHSFLACFFIGGFLIFFPAYVALLEGPWPLIVFFNVFGDEDPARVELIDEARTIGAVLFGKDITEVGLCHRRATRKLYFMSTNTDDNLRAALTLIGRAREDRRSTSPRPSSTCLPPAQRARRCLMPLTTAI